MPEEEGIKYICPDAEENRCEPTDCNHTEPHKRMITCGVACKKDSTGLNRLVSHPCRRC